MAGALPQHAACRPALCRTVQAIWANRRELTPYGLAGRCRPRLPSLPWLAGGCKPPMPRQRQKGAGIALEERRRSTWDDTGAVRGRPSLLECKQRSLPALMCSRPESADHAAAWCILTHRLRVRALQVRAGAQARALATGSRIGGCQMQRRWPDMWRVSPASAWQAWVHMAEGHTHRCASRCWVPAGSPMRQS